MVFLILTFTACIKCHWWPYSQKFIIMDTLVLPFGFFQYDKKWSNNCFRSGAWNDFFPPLPVSHFSVWWSTLCFLTLSVSCSLSNITCSRKVKIPWTPVSTRPTPLLYANHMTSASYWILCFQRTLYTIELKLIINYYLYPPGYQIYTWRGLRKTLKIWSEERIKTSEKYLDYRCCLEIYWINEWK